MPRAVVTIRYPGDVRKGFDTLRALSEQGDFLCTTRCVVESCEYAFGAADYFLVLFASTWSEISTAVEKVQAELNKMLVASEGETPREPSSSPSRTLTSTVLGQHPTPGSSLASQATTALELVVHLARADPRPLEGNLAERVGIKALVLEYALDRLVAIEQMSKAAEETGYNLPGIEHVRKAIEALRQSLPSKETGRSG
ncbi:MAG: hypothetical protein ACKVW3_17390 [Phycisphaerales bacterium]